LGTDPLTVNDLLIRIQAYRQTRRTAPKSMRPWLDRLIEDAEEQINTLSGSSSAAEGDGDGADSNGNVSPEQPLALMEPATPRTGDPAEPPGHSPGATDPRRTYPLDPDAPLQRTLGGHGGDGSGGSSTGV
jgi:hypothetical protein